MMGTKALRAAGLTAGLTAGATAGLVTVAGAAYAVPVNDFEMPFPCHQSWYGSSRPSHSPSPLAIDWNRTDDMGDPVVAAASGVVSRVENLGGSSYGLYVVIDHGSGESSVYAHLSAEFVSAGQRIDQGELLGLVGTSGNSTGSHLHYEQRLDGRDEDAWFHDRRFLMDSTLTSHSCVDTPIAGDWNGDRVAQIGLFRRAERPVFRLAWGPDTLKRVYGGRVDTPLVGDWDGNGVSDLGVRSGRTSTFVLRKADGSTRSLSFGYPSDRAVSGDWNGDGRWDVGVWRPSEATFYLRKADGGARRVQLGSVGSLPVTGDWNGDRRTDVGVFTAGTWTLQVVKRHHLGWSGTIRFGAAGDLPVTGDWNGDHATDLGTWTPGTATFRLRKAAAKSLEPGTILTRKYGRAR